MRIATTTLLLAALAVLTSCEENSPAPGTALVSGRWMLVAVEEMPIAVSSYSDTYRSYLQFNAQGSTTEGLAPCNSFGGTFALGAEAGQLTISPQFSTRTTCPAQTIEDNYLSALPRTVRYEISGKQLKLYDATNSTKVLLEFKAAE
ncbi:META domain-containing protein [Hymenobacter endophyticus]|uniref:META domain-containing protein n=1 Tax=Hymenobacter endophyticus TaxID=3076335 RepID=A0ABU3TE35_9BACT|nr:META domain-containing protein [Hymenobacter endophyticus]MDU0369628.1 META domain-containing protein [Hymenobacter endophyticus]